MVQMYGLGIDINHHGRAVRLRYTISVESRPDPGLGELTLTPMPDSDAETRQIFGAMLQIIRATFEKEGELPTTQEEGRNEQLHNGLGGPTGQIGEGP